MLYCSFQVRCSELDWSHFAISPRIYFCYDSEFPLCLVSLIAFYDNQFPYFTSGSLLLCFKLCFSHNGVRYSFLHLSHASSLRLCIYFCFFCKSLFSISVISSLGITGVLPHISKFWVKTGNWISSSM